MAVKEQNLRDKILALKRKKDALILVHNYQVAAVQEVGDYIGDSLHAVRESIKECQGSAWDSEKFAAAVENVRQRREARDAEESRSSHS